jgi:hypothetical protein
MPPWNDSSEAMLTTAPLPPRARIGLAGEEHRLEVDVDHRVPVRLSEVQTVGPADDAGVFDEDVDLAALKRVHRCHWVGEVELQFLRAVDHSHGLRAGRPPGGDHLCAGGAHRDGDRLADAGVGAGHEGGAALKREGAHRRSAIATMSMSVKSTLSPAIAQQKV